jgi:predicted dehydrogenase
MPDRRTFVQQLIGAATVAALPGTGTSRTVLGANDRIRFGLIGAGGRGKEIFRAALQCANVEAVAVADVYTRRLDEAKAIVPAVKTHKDFRHVLDDKSIDAVLIATPQHQHALSFVPAIQAGKDVYQEKTMAFNVDHAKRMRKAFVGSDRVVQIGMQMNSGPGIRKVREFITSDQMGTITAIEAHHFRNRAYGGWMREIPADCDTAHIDWPAFEGEATHKAFDPQRFMNWRFYWDYSGGNVFENMVHQVGFWYQVLDLKIPQSVTMTGANYHSPKMEMPDAMMVVMNQPEKILFSWSSLFSNSYYGETHDYLFGTKGTIMHDESERVVYVPQGKRKADPKGPGPESASPQPATYKDATVEHMQNFFECVRSRKQPVCPFDMGFRSAIACQMAVASYRKQRTVRWDSEKEEIV